MNEKPGWSEVLMACVMSTIKGNKWKYPGMKGNSLKSPEMALTRNSNAIQIFAIFPIHALCFTDLLYPLCTKNDIGF